MALFLTMDKGLLEEWRWAGTLNQVLRLKRLALSLMLILTMLKSLTLNPMTITRLSSLQESVVPIRIYL